jgi:hypothetical protein
MLMARQARGQPFMPRKGSRDGGMQERHGPAAAG